MEFLLGVGQSPGLLVQVVRPAGEARRVELGAPPRERAHPAERKERSGLLFVNIVLTQGSTTAKGEPVKNDGKGVFRLPAGVELVWAADRPELEFRVGENAKASATNVRVRYESFGGGDFVIGYRVVVEAKNHKEGAAPDEKKSEHREDAVTDKANPKTAKPVAKAETEKDQPAPGGNQIPDSVRTILEKADQIELFSMDPSVAGDKIKDNFHGSHVLGKIVIKDGETRTKLMKALTKGVKDKQTEVRTAAFYPRHAIRATHEKTTVDLLIGFDDSAIIVYNGDTFKGFVFTTASPQPVFDQVLRAAKVPLAKPNKK